MAGVSTTEVVIVLLMACLVILPIGLVIISRLCCNIFIICNDCKPTNSRKRRGTISSCLTSTSKEEEEKCSGKLISEREALYRYPFQVDYRPTLHQQLVGNNNWNRLHDGINDIDDSSQQQLSDSVPQDTYIEMLHEEFSAMDPPSPDGQHWPPFDTQPSQPHSETTNESVISSENSSTGIDSASPQTPITSSHSNSDNAAYDI